MTSLQAATSAQPIPGAITAPAAGLLPPAAEASQVLDLDDFPEEALLSDVQAAITRIRNRIHGSNAAQLGRAPVVLKSHLYTILADRTAVDRELDALRMQNKVRIYKLATGERLETSNLEYMRTMPPTADMDPWSCCKQEISASVLQCCKLTAAACGSGGKVPAEGVSSCPCM